MLEVGLVFSPIYIYTRIHAIEHHVINYLSQIQTCLKAIQKV